jgi:dihydroxyacid dehydratase/phosphogluconate dehydratase
MTKPRNETPEQREKRLAYHRAYSRSALGRASDKRRYTPERKRKITANKHLRMHGITRSEVDTLAQRQDHKCGICSKPFTDAADTLITAICRVSCGGCSAPDATRPRARLQTQG